jgi:hypothetical protein
VTEFQGSLDFCNGYLPAARDLPNIPTLGTAALLAVLFAILYPIAQTSVVKSASTGVDQADGSRRPLIGRGRAPMHDTEERS